MRRFPSLRGVIEDALATPRDALRVAAALRDMAGILSQAPGERARIFAPGLVWPCSKIYTTGQLKPIPAGLPTQDTSIQIQNPGVVVGILISSRGLEDDQGVSLPLDVEAANLAWQLTREQTIVTAANATNNTSVSSTDGYASARGMTSQWPWLPTVIPVRGAGGWQISLRNLHPTRTIAPIVNLAFLDGADAYALACASLARPNELEQLGG